MKRSTAPCWMEAILLLMLPPRDSETITGDLHEEFQGRLPKLGRLRANLWYARQVLSFLPHHAATIFGRSPALMLVSGFTGLCGAWFTMTGLRHSHPGHRAGQVIAAIILLQAALTLVALCLRPVTLLRRTSVAGTLALVWLAFKALIATVHGAKLEGYVLLIALLLLAQVALTLRSLPEWHAPRTS